MFDNANGSGRSSPHTANHHSRCLCRFPKRPPSRPIFSPITANPPNPASVTREPRRNTSPAPAVRPSNRRPIPQHPLRARHRRRPSPLKTLPPPRPLPKSPRSDVARRRSKRSRPRRSNRPPRRSKAKRALRNPRQRRPRSPPSNPFARKSPAPARLLRPQRTTRANFWM